MKFFIVGATGRMGQEIRRLIETDSKDRWMGGFAEGESDDPRIQSSLDKVKKTFDVVIDFSSPAAFQKILYWCESQKTPLFSGTTGLTKADFSALKKVSKTIPVLWAANTSVGVHIVKKVLREMKIPVNFDVQITEYHHHLKKDRPSGTALVLQQTLRDRQIKAPEPLSIRGGGIFGVHRVDLMAPEEVITIEHQALSRALFARGAIDGAAWLKNRKPGLYTMDDFIAEMSE